MLTSVAFAVGIASVPMVGMAIGADRIARARRIAWTAGLVSFVSVGVIGTLIAIFPDLWVEIFTRDAGVRAASRQYLSIAGADVRLHRARDVDVFFFARSRQGFGAGAGAKRAAVVYRRSAAGGCRGTARHRCELLRAGRGVDGGARRAVRRERHVDPMGPEGSPRCAGPAGIVLDAD